VWQRLGQVLARWALALTLVTACVTGLVGAPAAGAASTVSAWGENLDGELGLGYNNGPEGCTFGFCSRKAVAVPGVTGVKALAGGSQSLALLTNGTLMAWGRGFGGELGIGTREDSWSPVPVPGLEGVTAIAAGYGHSMALLSSGKVMDWGENLDGALGDGTTNEETGSPVAVKGITEATAIAGSGGDGYALLKNGTVMAWGNNYLGELGDGTSGGSSDVPVPVSGLHEAIAISANGGHALALLRNGTVMAWGENEYGELGDHATAFSDLPVPVSGLRNVIAIADGSSHNLALLRNGTVVAWGQNDWGQLGQGTTEGPEKCGPTSCSTVPLAVPGLTEVIAIATGYEHDIALLADGDVMTWGEDFHGQLGAGNIEISATPVSVIGLSKATAIAAGDYHGLAEVNGARAHIAGTVTSAITSAPIEGVSACAIVAAGAGTWHCARTNAAGAYSIALDASGTYTVSFTTPPGSAYVATSYYNGKASRSEAEPVTATLGSTTSGIDAALPEGGRITGVVTEGAGKTPVAGVQVCATESETECATSNAAGKYAITQLETGSYVVEFTPPNDNLLGLLPQWYRDKATRSEAESVGVTAGTTRAGIDANLRTSGSISGTVTNVATRAATEGVTVCASSPSVLASVCANTGPRGTYLLSALPPGDYELEFNAHSGAYRTQWWKDRHAASEAEPLVVDAGTKAEGINAAMEPVVSGSIGGKVVDRSTTVGIPGIEVCAYGEPAGVPSEECAATNAKGQYALAGLASGLYDIEYFSPPASGLDYVTQYYDERYSPAEAEEVAVNPGASTGEVDASLELGGRITGRIVEASSAAPLEEAVACAFTLSAVIAECANASTSGTYAMVVSRGDYKVGFIAGPSYAMQFYNDSSSFAGASPLLVELGATRAGINASLLPREVPVTAGAPTISGEAVVGSTLQVSHAPWSGNPTSYSDEWGRCSSSGAIETCHTIATGNTYAVRSEDIGHTIRVRETATNAAGTSRPAFAAPTAVVTVPTGGGAGSAAAGAVTPAAGAPAASWGVLGQTASAPSAAQVRALLAGLLAPRGRGARISVLLAHRGYALAFHAPWAGRLTISWSLPARRARRARAAGQKPVAVGTVLFTHSGVMRAFVKLTGRGAALLRHAKSVNLLASGTLSPTGGPTVTAKAPFTLRR
jgi:alpha-tubulin suppressor-like RCC1 family protein